MGKSFLKDNMSDNFYIVDIAKSLQDIAKNLEDLTRLLNVRLDAIEDRISEK